MNNHLFLFTIGPVQGFISQARKTRDLYAGSQILSLLVATGVKTFEKEFPYGSIIFPSIAGSNTSLPNRFIGKVIGNAPTLKEKGNIIEQSVQDAWYKIAKTSLNTSGETDRLNDLQWKAFEAQIKGWLNIHWLFQEIDNRSTNPYANAYQKIERLGGAIKNIRSFSQYQYDGEGEKGRKCSIDGINNVLFYKKRGEKDKVPNQALVINSFALNPGEGLSAVSFTKRFFDNKDRQPTKFPSTAEIALLDDLKNLEGNLPGFRECYEKLFTKDPSQIIQVSQRIIQNGWKDNVQLPNLNVSTWNDDFDAHYFFEENLNEKTIPNDLQRHLLKDLHKQIKKYLKTRYYAIVLFDGDKMGSWLSGEYNTSKTNLEEFHKNLSGFLGNFGDKVSQSLSLSRCNGQTVYAGGDDFLGFVNIHHLFPTIKDLRTDFDVTVNQLIEPYKNPEKHLTFSAGIVIAHYKTPFSEVLKKARAVESDAKKEGDRNAFGIAILKHSGEIQQAVYKWDTKENSPSACSNWEALEMIYSELENETGNFSNTFIQNLTLEIAALTGTDMCSLRKSRTEQKIQDEVIPLEIKRLVNRSFQKQNNKKDIPNLSDKVIQLWKNKPTESSHSPRNFVHALHIADFMTRKINKQ